VQDKFDTLKSTDETLEPIIKELKHKNFIKLKVLCYLTGTSIISSISLVFLNKYYIPNFCVYVIAASVINIVTIIWAINFIITIINPDKIENTAKKLISQNKDLNAGNESDTIKIGEFLEKFIKLENLVRNSFSKLGFEIQVEKNEKPPYRLHDLFMMLFQLELIQLDTLGQLNEINRIRNLAAHGQIERVDKKYDIMLDDLIQRIDGLKR